MASRLLEAARTSKRTFNINNKDDLEEYRFFKVNSKWRKANPFTLEWPHLSVVSMIEGKIVNKFLKLD